MRYRLRTLLILLAVAAGMPASAADSNDIMRILLSNSEFVILGEVESVGGTGLLREAASHIQWKCKIKVLDVLKGKTPPTNPIHAVIDILSDHPSRPKKGNRSVFLLNPNDRNNPKFYLADDIRFGVQPASMAQELKRMADEMAAQQVSKQNP